MPLRPEDRKAFYTPAEVAALARVDPKTILNWVHAGRLYAVPLSPRIYRVPLGAVMKLLAPEEVRIKRSRLRGPVPRAGAGEPPVAGAQRQRHKVAVRG